MSLQHAIKKLVAFEELQPQEMITAMEMIMLGQATNAQIAGFLVAMEMKGPTVTELSSAVEVMRAFANKITIDRSPIVDIVGTGGDNSCSFNISTTSAFAVAAAGGIVAKHGNRSVSSSCGSADVLEQAGVNLNITPEKTKQCIEEIGIGFLFAPNYHPANKYAAQPRKELAIRTFFNLLGPLTNPADANHLMIGVFHSKWLEPVAKVLANLNCKSALIVHSQDGLDEISCATATDVAELKEGKIKTYTIKPQDFDLSPQPLESLRVNNAKESLALLQSVLDNESSPARDIVLLNAGATIYVAGLVNSIKDGVINAREMLASGKAKEKFQQLVHFTKQLG